MNSSKADSSKRGQFWKPGDREPTSATTSSTATTTNGNSNSSNNDKITLSKGVMGMKFMKRKQEADVQGRMDNDKRKRLLASVESSSGSIEINDLTRQSNDSKIANNMIGIDNDGNSDCINGMIVSTETDDAFALLPGRRSFGGCNKIVEVMYQDILNSRRYDEAVKKANKNTISDEEMLIRYQNLIGLPGRKLQEKKRNKH